MDIRFAFLTSLEEMLPTLPSPVAPSKSVRVCPVPFVREGGGDHRMATEELVETTHCSLFEVSERRTYCGLRIGVGEVESSLLCLVAFSAAHFSMIRSMAFRLSMSGVCWHLTATKRHIVKSPLLDVGFKLIVSCYITRATFELFLSFSHFSSLSLFFLYFFFFSSFLLFFSMFLYFLFSHFFPFRFL